MPRFMLPRYVEVVDDLPRTEASMRVRKHEIRARGVTDHTYDREKAVAHAAHADGAMRQRVARQERSTAQVPCAAASDE